MTSEAAVVATGGPKGEDIVEHIVGWLLVVVLAVFVTSIGLL
ncbi:SCO1431 family membrane protein [Streptomyces sp. NPDC058471]